MKTCRNCGSEAGLKPDNVGRLVCIDCEAIIHEVDDDSTIKIRLAPPPPGTGRTMAPMTHDLKIQSKYFDAIASGEKRFEVRKNDRLYQVGDTLRLHEILKHGEKREPRTFNVEVTYILYGGLFGIDPDYCIMSIRASHLMEDFQFEAEIPGTIEDFAEMIVDKATDLEEKSEKLKDEAEKEIK